MGTEAAGSVAELVLVGAGHAHVQVLRRFMMRPLPGVRLTLVVDRAEAVYSGMVPGFVAGEYQPHELEIDAVPLARRAGARLLLSAATRVDPACRRIELEGRPAIFYDVASLDVGSTVRGLELPGVLDHALATRPIRSFVDALDARVKDAAATAPGPLELLVVGGGAAGTELAFALETRLRCAGMAARVGLVTDADELLPGASARLVRATLRELGDRGIELHAGARVAGVEAERVLLEGGGSLPAQLVVWATGAAPAPLLAASPLPKDARGFLRVDDHLRVLGVAGLFAAGDCAQLERHPWVPKAGVYAVRQGSLLDANLRAQLLGRPLRRYRPQRDFLALLNLGGQRALGGKWGLALRGHLVWRLKDAIDRRFMRRFQVLNEAGTPAPDFPAMETMDEEEMVCGGCAAKVGPELLPRALGRLAPGCGDASLLLGLEPPDDAAAWRLPGGTVQLASVDGFRAFTDDPWLVGRVAAVNALSDLYAKGGLPRHALALVSVPRDPPEHVEEILYQVMAGIRAALDPLEVALVGGHSTAGAELFVGLSVSGTLAKDLAAPLPLGGLRVGQRLVLSKALGTGVLLAADMRGRARGCWVRSAHAAMLRPNAEAAQLAREHRASACTDISGFGLAGHLLEMLDASGVSARLQLDAIPALPGALPLLEAGLRSTFHPQNAALARRLEGTAVGEGAVRRELLFDPQTSGGLLIGVDPECAGELVSALVAAGDAQAGEIGEVVPHPGAGPSCLLC